jgi:hypothetical protein
MKLKKLKRFNKKKIEDRTFIKENKKNRITPSLFI